MTKLSVAHLSSQLLWAFSALMFCMFSFVAPYGKTIIITWHLTSISTISFDIPLIIDSTTLIFAAVVLFISANIVHFSAFYMKDDPFLQRFNALVLLFVLSMLLLLFLPHLMALLLGWDGLGLVSFLLVIYYQNPKSLAAGMITALTNRIGDVFLLLSFGLMMHQSHWNILNMWTSSFNVWITFMIMLAAMTKSAQIPFSSWLPAAMAAPTPVSALVHSSTLVTAGVFLLIRFYPFLSLEPLFNKFLLMTACTTMLMAGAAAMVEWDLKKIIALSTLSQLGVMMASIGLGFPNLALFHLLTHALFKALLFLTAGSFIAFNSHTQDLRMTGAIADQLPLTTALFITANMALCGTPFLAGFYSKDLIIEMFLYTPSNVILSLMLLLATGLTVTYSIRLFMTCIISPKFLTPLSNTEEKQIPILFPGSMLCLGAIMSGAILNWCFLPTLSHPFLSFPTKMLTISIIITSAIFIWFLLKRSPHLTSPGKSSLANTSLSNMLFLTPISSQGMMPAPFKSASLLFLVVDQGWTEKLSGQGMFSAITSSAKPLQLLLTHPVLQSIILLAILSIPLILMVV